MNRGILEHVWKSYVIVAVLFVCSNTAFAFDDIETMRRNMSKGDVITNTDSIDYLFGIDRVGIENTYNCIHFGYYVDRYDSLNSASIFITKDSLEELIIPDTINSNGDTAIVREIIFGKPIYYPSRISNYDNRTYVSQKYEIQNFKLKQLVIPKTIQDLGNLNNFLSLETVVIEQSPDSCYELNGNISFFGNCPNLKSVILPEGIEYLPCESFENCSSLKKIVLPQSLEIIERDCFTGCTQLEKIYIPANVRAIDETAFMDCPNLKEIIIDSNNKYYDSRDNCNAIIDSKTNTLIRACSTSTIPEGVQIIAENAFQNCKVQSITIPEGVRIIPKHAFQNCDIQSVTIPESVTTICDLAFENSSIQELNIPASVDSIGLAICAGCMSLNKITVDKKNKKYDSRKDCNAIIRTADNTLITASNNAYIPNGVEILGECAFFGSGITNIYIPQSVKKVGSQTFAGCISLGKITVDKSNKVYYSENNCLIKDKTLVAGCSKSVIPSDITTIGAFAFRYIPLYWKLDIPDNITEIQSHAFSECNTIECLTLPDSLTLLGDYAFAACNNLTSVVINSVDKFGEGAFFACRKLYNVLFTSPIDTLERYAFSNCLNLKTIVLPNGIKCIGNSAFSGCPRLEYVSFPSTLEEIESAAFKDCISLKSVYLPKGLKRMNNNQTFSSCNSLTEVELPDSLMLNRSLRWGAFKDCKNLETIKIPLSKFQEGIYSQVFQGCTRLNKVILK